MHLGRFCKLCVTMPPLTCSICDDDLVDRIDLASEWLRILRRESVHECEVTGGTSVLVHHEIETGFLPIMTSLYKQAE
jgi:hypothetical protein